MLTSPIGLTNTHSVGVVHDALIAAEVERRAGGEDFGASRSWARRGTGR